MTERLDQLNAEIEAVKKRMAEIDEEIVALADQREEKRKEQGSAIVEKRNPEKIIKELVALQEGVKGAQAAHSQLAATLRGLEEQRAAELREIGKAEAETARSEIAILEVRLYSRLVDVAESLPDLLKKRAEYIAALKKAGAKERVGIEDSKIAHLLEALKKGILELLGHFPRSILADGKLPTPEDVRRSLR
ncbi:MAG: hypothetical protein ACOYYU_10370 [Chloroflexota bacterium]